MADPNTRPYPSGRFRGPTGRIYGGESAPKRDALGHKHYDGDNYGRSNRIYGQDRPKLPRPPKGKPKRRAL